MRPVHCVAALVVVATLSGCGGNEVARLRDYITELELESSHDQTAYVELGTFDVTALVKLDHQRQAEGERAVPLRLKFELFVETPDIQEAAVQAAVEARRGGLNDEFLTIIRSSTADELTDPRLSALKQRMTEAARMVLPATAIRQLVFDKLTVQAM